MFRRSGASGGVSGLARGASVLALTLAAWACDGPNRFSGPGRVDARGGQAPRVEIESPRGDSLSARPLGDSILVRARVRDDVGVDSVRLFGVALRGDPSLGTDRVVTRFQPRTVVLGSARDTVLTRYLTATADTTREVVQIVVQAFDADGQVGADTTRVTLGGPFVALQNLQNNQPVQSGLSLGLQLRAADPSGITGVEFRISGAFADTLRTSFNPARDSVRVDTAVMVPAGLTGDIQVVAVAQNSLSISSQDGPIRLRVVPPGAQDVTRPTLSMTIQAPARLEAGDSVRVVVSGSDDAQGSGIARVGITVLARAPGRGTTETRVITRDFVPPRTGAITETLAFAPINVDPRLLPDTLVLDVTAFLIDAGGNCAAAPATGQTLSLPCVVGADGAVTALATSGARISRTVVAGRTVTLPAGGRIMDAVVDRERGNLLLSNFTRNRVEVFGLASQAFTTFIPVGSEPWGLEVDRTGDTLLVANSGGTNISKIALDQNHEAVGSRILTPRVAFFDVETKLTQTGAPAFTVSYISGCPLVVPPVTGNCFSDRPQFLVQDHAGRMLYSTRRTSLGFFGTIRKAFVPAGMRRVEVQLFFGHARPAPNENFVSIVHADSVTLVGTPPDQIIVWDHIPGDSLLAVGGPAPTPDSAVKLARQQGSDAEAIVGYRYSAATIGFSDTTYVARSGDRRWAVFGEGSLQFGRLIMYDAGADRVSDVIDVNDLMRNTAERVRGIGLNWDGTLGVARGNQAYFFTTDLRLQGVAAVAAGGAGATLHPLHANARSIDNPGGVYEPNTHLAFLGTGERTIDIVDTFHFFRSGRIFIRDVIAGPLRAVLPLAGDNAGLPCRTRTVTDRFGRNVGEAVEIFANGDFNFPYPPDGPTSDQCVVVKLVAVTDGGGVVVIDVRKGDVLRNHPSRNR